MKIILISRVLMFSLIIVISSKCSFFYGTQKNERKIKKEIINGVTTESMIINLLGMPASVTPNNIGDEVWNYKNLTYSTRKSDDEKTLTLWEFTTGDSTEISKPYDLLITIDQNDIVKNFEVIRFQSGDN